MTVEGRQILAVQIVQPPLGEAQLWVREAWVGLTLPLVPGQYGERESYTVGVLTGPYDLVGQILRWTRGRLKTTIGYAVDRDAAFAVLGEHRPDALNWWREESAIGKRRGTFMFDAPACEPIYFA